MDKLEQFIKENRYLNESYPYYLVRDSGKGLSKNDRDFLIKVISNSKSETTWEMNVINPADVVRRLDRQHYQYKALYNKSIVSYIHEVYYDHRYVIERAIKVESLENEVPLIARMVSLLHGLMSSDDSLMWMFKLIYEKNGRNREKRLADPLFKLIQERLKEKSADSIYIRDEFYFLFEPNVGKLVDIYSLLSIMTYKTLLDLDLNIRLDLIYEIVKNCNLKIKRLTNISRTLYYSMFKNDAIKKWIKKVGEEGFIELTDFLDLVTFYQIIGIIDSPDDFPRYLSITTDVKNFILNNIYEISKIYLEKNKKDHMVEDKELGVSIPSSTYNYHHTLEDLSYDRIIPTEAEKEIISIEILSALDDKPEEERYFIVKTLKEFLKKFLKREADYLKELSSHVEHINHNKKILLSVFF